MSAFEPEASGVGIRQGRADREESQDDSSSITISSSSSSNSSSSSQSPSSGLYSGRDMDEESPDSAQRKREHSETPDSASSSFQQQGQPTASSNEDESHAAEDRVSAEPTSAPERQVANAEEAPERGAEEENELNEEQQPRRTNSEYSEEDDTSEQWEEAVSSAEEGSIPFESDDGSSSSSSDSDSSTDTPESASAAAATVDSAAAEAGEQLGCSHYRRKCKIVAPCCEIDRHAVEEVICAACDTRQPVSNKCMQCQVTFGAYFCPICKFWDDLGEKKKVYHCGDCGICRLGGRENYFHCQTCDSCYPLQLQNKHKCLENAMRRQCPVCLEDMFSSLRQSQVLQCGHTIHADCLRLLQKQKGFQAIRCPVCSKSIADYSEFWKQLSDEIARTPMEDDMKRKVRIACNDCLERSTTDFHFLGLKCMHCNSFNTRDVAED
ncbi:zinc finger (CHY type) protein, putative [Eimeria maxima]|uniref:Zinc finger (CHY type) protein, putative n=1 Tax=Eimeria maxima TaxID=5804 RepID=U6MA97_EIMMA|nr:zinc finger (CHY type) protein, putative [Eimeria maxima]CDJ59424.1 zinc finger (CHY type) protein, putative [Eimeria maxima]